MLRRRIKMIIVSLESNKKPLSFYQKLKENAEFLSNLVPVLGAVYTIMLVLFQYKYCLDAEKFYKIDSIHFLTDNIQRLLRPLLFIIIYLIFMFNFKCYLSKGSKIKKDYVLNCFINIIASVMFMGGVLLSSLPCYIKVILFLFALAILIMECICLIVCFLKKLSKVKYYMQNKFECNLIKENKIKQVSVPNCFINKAKKCTQNDLFTDIRDFLCYIFIFCAVLFWSYALIDNNRFFQKRKYEIIQDVNTDFDSNKLDVEVVILHKGSQIITKKGKIVDDTLYIDKYSYEIKEFSQYKYILRGFTEVDNNHNLQKKILLSKGIDNRRRNISLQRECKISQSKFRCWIYGGIYFEN